MRLNSNLEPSVDRKLDLLIYGSSVNRSRGDQAYQALYSGKAFDTQNRDAVKMLQRVLVLLDYLPSAASVNGLYDAATQAAVRFFQNLNGIRPSDGILSAATSQALYGETRRCLSGIRMEEVAVIAACLDPGQNGITTQLPESGPGFFRKANSSSDRQYALSSTISALMRFAKNWSQSHPDKPLRIGEISVYNGGRFGQHVGEAHAYGLGVDIGLFRKDGKDAGTTYLDKATYDQVLVKQLAEALMNCSDVARIIFNDPAIQGNGKLGRDKQGGHVHDNHIHVEFVNPYR